MYNSLIHDIHILKNLINVRHILNRSADHVAFLLFGVFVIDFLWGFWVKIFIGHFVYFIFKYWIVFLLNKSNTRQITIKPHPVIITPNAGLFYTTIWLYFFYKPYIYGFLWFYMLKNKQLFNIKTLGILVYNIFFIYIFGFPKFLISIFNDWVTVLMLVLVENKPFEYAWAALMADKTKETIELYELIRI